MFDNYTLKARYYPVIILFFPILILGFCYSFQYASIIHLAASTGAAGVLTYLFSQLGRDKGKHKEPLLWNHWGGMPSIQLLRSSNSLIDSYTKQRYYQKLFQLCPVTTIDVIDIKQLSSSQADEVYLAWTKYLIGQTRDKKKYPLLFKENVSYGFRRNLWGLKIISISFISILILGNYLFWASKLNAFNPLFYPDTYKYSTVALFILILFWIFVVTKNWVRIVAFAYAERLCESLENM